MGAVAVTNLVHGVAGAYRTVECDVTFSASYATGGDTFSPATLGLRQVDDVHVLGYKKKDGTAITAVGIQTVFAGTSTSPLLQAWFNGSQVTNATNLSSLGVVRMEIRGH